MLLKSLLAGAIFAGMAGSAVYFGVGEDGSLLTPTPQVEKPALESRSDDKVPARQEAEAHPHSANSKLEKMMGGKPKPKAIVMTSPDPVEAKRPDAKKVVISPSLDGDMDQELDVDPNEGASEVDIAQTEKPKTETRKKRWLDEYFKSDKSELEAQDAAVEKAVPAKKPDSDMTPTAMTGGAVQTEVTKEKEVLKDGRIKTVTTTTMTSTDSKGRKTVRKEVETTIEKTVSEKPKPMKPQATGAYVVKTEEVKDKLKVTVTPRGNDEMFEILMAEAAKLEIPDMRDQAYLNIVDYAVAKDNRDVATAAMKKLSREELRDTARGNMAVASARSGDVDAAFAMLDDLEIDELQDPIRLQIIEALTRRKNAKQ